MRELRLSRQEVSFFVREGYIIKRQALDPVQLEAARNLFQDHQTTGDNPNFDRSLVAEPILLDLLPRRCFAVAEQLLGAGTLVPPTEGPADVSGPKLSGGGVAGGQHLRGIISRPPDLPGTSRRTAGRGCHVDAHPFSLGAVAYLWDVSPGNGEFTVFPRSHHRAFHCFPWQYSSRRPSHEPGEWCLKGRPLLPLSGCDPLHHRQKQSFCCFCCFRVCSMCSRRRRRQHRSRC
eukprot:SAG31_NODE_916_length_11047_cov_3.507033_5_plen_233_part_00